jgi:hypothetical protein
MKAQRTTLDAGHPISPTMVMDQFREGPVGIQCVPSGGANTSLQLSLDDPFQAGGVVNWFNHVDAATVNSTLPYQVVLNGIPRAIRVILNNGTGSADVIVNQTMSW